MFRLIPDGEVFLIACAYVDNGVIGGEYDRCDVLYKTTLDASQTKRETL